MTNMEGPRPRGEARSKNATVLETTLRDQYDTLEAAGANPRVLDGGDWFSADCPHCGDGCRMLIWTGSWSCPHGCHMDRQETELAATARVYAASGWFIFPLEDRGKRPRVKWADEATTDEAKVAAWWKQWPEANIGIHCGRSGLVVLDVDPRNGGMESLSALPVDLPKTGAVETGGDGVHLYYSGNRRKGKINGYPGLDVQADRGYIVAPPSVHPSGKKYVWTHYPVDMEPWPVELDQLGNANKVEEKQEPSEFARLGPVISGDGSAYANGALRAQLRVLDAAGEGTRNPTLNDSAFNLGQFVGAGLLDEQVVIRSLQTVARRIGLEEHEILPTIFSGLRAGKANPRRGLAA